MKRVWVDGAVRAAVLERRARVLRGARDPAEWNDLLGGCVAARRSVGRGRPEPEGEEAARRHWGIRPVSVRVNLGRIGRLRVLGTEPREREAEDDAAEDPTHGSAPVIARLHDGSRASTSRRGRRRVGRSSPRLPLRFRGICSALTTGPRRLTLRHPHLRYGLPGVRGDAERIRFGRHLRQRRERFTLRRDVHHGAQVMTERAREMSA